MKYLKHSEIRFKKLEALVPFWNSVKDSETVWNILKLSEIHFETFETQDTFWNSLKFSETVWKIFKHFETVWNTFWNIWHFWYNFKQFETWWNSLVNSKAFWSILKHFEQLYNSLEYILKQSEINFRRIETLHTFEIFFQQINLFSSWLETAHWTARSAKFGFIHSTYSTRGTNTHFTQPEPNRGFLSNTKWWVTTLCLRHTMITIYWTTNCLSAGNSISLLLKYLMVRLTL